MADSSDALPRFSPSPVTFTYRDGDELRIDESRLPPLPDISSFPSELRELPFLHKSWLMHLHRHHPNARDCELRSHKRSEFVGDAAIYFYIASWLISTHPLLDSGSATRIRTALVSNTTLSRLCVRYGLDKLLKHAAGASLQETETRKMWADTFEAYIGVVWTGILQGLLPQDTLLIYFNSLLSEGSFPDIEAIIDGSRANQNARQRRSQLRTAIKRQRQEQDQAISSVSEACDAEASSKKRSLDKETSPIQSTSHASI